MNKGQWENVMADIGAYGVLEWENMEEEQKRIVAMCVTWKPWKPGLREPPEWKDVRGVSTDDVPYGLPVVVE